MQTGAPGVLLAHTGFWVLCHQVGSRGSELHRVNFDFGCVSAVSRVGG